jgi:hypothetical protein
VRVAPVVLLLCLLLAAPATAHDLGATHTDSRIELAGTDVGATVSTVEAAAGTEDEGLPVTWCGSERTTDDTANAVFPQQTQQFKLVYAYASDRPNRFALWQDALQADVSLIGRFMGAQSGGRKTPRFDMGTDCGPQYVDVQVVALPGPQSKYSSRDLDVLKADVGAVVPATYGERNVIVLADRLSNASAWYGIGESWLTETSSAPHNAGGLFSALWVPDALSAPGPSANGWWPEGLLHELTHNLGAVGQTAPHASLHGHCYDGHDVMCYDDGGLPQPLTTGCPLIPGVMNQVFDCGGDDYFNVAPAAGSYLATKWNTYNSRYLASCVEAAPACGGTTVPDSNPQPPVSTTQPTVAGDARAGATLTASTGGWANAPTGYAYQWERGDGSTWSAAPGATGATYPLTGADVGLRLRVRVIATNADGSTAAYSASTTPVTGPAATVSETVPVSTSSTPAAFVPNRGRATLRIARGRGRGKRLGTIDFQITGGRLRALATRVKLARGRYELRLCTTAGGSRCARRTLKVARSSIARLPGLSLGVPAGATGRVSYTVRATRGVFSALTAKRAGAGLLLGP